MEPVITVKNIGKKYKIAHDRGKYVALRDVLAGIAKRPFSFVKHKARKAAGFEKKEEFWALKGVDFSVNAGEVVGIIGHNGAGKSTLLKILSQITPPSEGEIVIRGRIGSLLEVGTGFHPELTGRENIFLNGAILGMHRSEIAEKFDQIVEFSGIGKFLDTPVKYYSSGMYVRLAFSVAAHMEPDILLVDEVLAVGDAEFQKKCIGKMEDITRKDGRTILLVSHNLSSIEQLCDKVILLKNGAVEKIGETSEVIAYYLNREQASSAVVSYRKEEGKDARIRTVSILGSDGKPALRLPISGDFSIDVEFEVEREIDRSIVCLMVYSDGDLLYVASDRDKEGTPTAYAPGRYVTRFRIPAYFLNIGYYGLDLSIQKPSLEFIDHREGLVCEIIPSDDNPRQNLFSRVYGKVAPFLEVTTTRRATGGTAS